MEEIVKDIERFWSEAMQTLKEIIEKSAGEMVDPTTREPGLTNVRGSQNEENHDCR